MFIKVSISYQQLLRIQLISTLLFLLPFVAADLSIIYNDSSLCFLQGIKSVAIDPFAWMLLGHWLKYDGFIKLAILAFGIFFLRLNTETKQTKLIVLAFSNLLTLFWVFNSVWNIVGGVIYWNDITHKLCTDTVNQYMPALLIINYILSPLGFIISRIRPSFLQKEAEQSSKSGRRDTELKKM